MIPSRLILFCAVSITLSAQSYFIGGRIISKESGNPLSFANVRVVNSNVGVAANKEGEYEIKLSGGNYSLIFSFIGFKSDTVDVQLETNIEMNIELQPTSVELDEVTVMPGINPALGIIARAVEAKQIRTSKIIDYKFNAYTKGLIKTTKDISASDGGVGVNIGEADTAQLKITGILENESKGYFKKPDNYKEEIIARKQSANFPSSINTLTGGRIIQDFYRDDIEFSGREMTNPVSEDGLDFYFYYLEDSLAYEEGKVYQIYFEPDDRSDPGFYGRVYITGDSYDIAKIDLNLNDAANPGGIFTRVNVFQQFIPFENDIYMPIDYRLFIEGNFLGLVKFGFEINSIMYDYEINTEIEDDFFDMALLTVLPEADKKDSTYWTQIQSIPNTVEETEAYHRIDSLASVPVTFWDKFSPLNTRQNITDNFSVTGLLGLYHFNRVEGNGLEFGFYFDDLLDRRFDADFEISNGFADKKFKYDIDAHYLFGDYRTHGISISAFDRIGVLFGESDEYNSLVPTLTSLFGKYDFKDYFYSKGFTAKLGSEVFPVLELGLEFSNRTDRTAFTNSDFSFFNRDKKYDANQKIFNTTINSLTPSFKIDFRRYIEDGYYRRRRSENKSYLILSGNVFVSSAYLLHSDFDFSMYKLNAFGVVNSFGLTRLIISIKNIWSDGPIPYQYMHALPGNIQSLGQDYTFRTLDFAEVYGDKVTTLNLQYNTGDELFTGLNIPVLEDLQLKLSFHFNAAWSKITKRTRNWNRSILQDDVIEFKKPFYEIGFGIGQILLPLQFEFTWKLNHRGKDDFVFGINSVVF